MFLYAFDSERIALYFGITLPFLLVMGLDFVLHSPSHMEKPQTRCSQQLAR